jgi:8-oxo-dGTP pyrophosphatase MutT (NUDIX family)
MRRDFAVGPRIASHATAFEQGPPGEPAQSRPASTVVLLRDGERGPQVFLMRRTPSMQFAPRQHVFPGGGVDPRDCDVDLPWSGPDVDWWALALDLPAAQAVGAICAAVREVFEECGVLLAGSSGAEVVADLADPSWEADRLALLDHTLALTTMLQRRGLVLRSDLLRPWAHWLTPTFEPRRYDTYFFVAALPAGQVAREVGGESDHALWLDADQAVAGGLDGSLAMMPPTLVTVQEVAAATSVAGVLARPRRVRRVSPWLVRTSSDLVLRVDLDGEGGGEPGPPSGLEGFA